MVRQALSQILGRAGMIVTTANDPIIAMEKMRRERPDVIVLDIEMPKEAIARGAMEEEEVLPLPEIAQAVLKWTA